MSKEENIPEEQNAMVNEPSAGENNPLQQQGEDLSTNQSEDSKIKIKIMEPHIHPHLNHDKKWKDYLFEFIMLFLAVFCGFIAENIRENSVERHREKEYIRSFIGDLKNDTASMRLAMNEITFDNTGMDSLLHLAKQNISLSQQDIRRFYFLFIKYVPNIRTVTWNDGTIQQLKNAGGLRLIQKAHAADSIMKYDVYKKNIGWQWDTYKAIAFEVADASDHIIDWTVFEGRKPDDLLSLNPVPAFVQDKPKLQFFLNKLVKLKATGGFYKNEVETQFQNASRLLAFLQKEYRLP